MECVKRQSGSRLPWMLVSHSQKTASVGAPHFDAGQEDAALAHIKEHLSWRLQRGCDTCACCGLWANAGRAHAVSHVQRLCSEGLQRRSPKDGFEKSQPATGDTEAEHYYASRPMAGRGRARAGGCEPDVGGAGRSAFESQYRRIIHRWWRLCVRP